MCCLKSKYEGKRYTCQKQIYVATLPEMDKQLGPVSAVFVHIANILNM